MLATLILALVVLGPMAAFQYVARRPAATRGQLVRAAAFAGAAPMLVWVSGVALFAPADVGMALLLYVSFAAAYGAAIGGAGIFARWLGARRAGRP